MNRPDGPPLLLLVGGGGGLVGRALLEEFSRDHRIRSVHRHDVPGERARGVEWIRADVAGPIDWGPILDGVDLVVNVAWHRAGPEARFRDLGDGLVRMTEALERASPAPRLVHVSVPSAPPDLEERLPYLVHKRRVDATIMASGLSYTIVRPSALFGPGDVLLGVMIRQMHRYPFFPMFSDGRYHLSPLAVTDLARIVRTVSVDPDRSIHDLGGPVRFEYRDLTDRMFRALGKRARYWHLSERSARRLARTLERLGSNLLYEYEVEWLLSDRLGLPSAESLAPGLASVEAYLLAEAARYGRPRSPSGSGSAA